MKLKKLLPIAAVASTAAIVAPIITACSCGTNIKLDKYEVLKDPDSSAIHPILRSDKSINMKKDKKYTFNIDMKNWKFDGGSEGGWWSVSVVDNYNIFEESTTFPMVDYKVWIDGKELQLVKDTSELESGKFYYSDNGSVGFYLVGEYTDLKPTSKMKVELKVTNELKDVYPLFTPHFG